MPGGGHPALGFLLGRIGLRLFGQKFGLKRLDLAGGRAGRRAAGLAACRRVQAQETVVGAHGSRSLSNTVVSAALC